MNWLRKRVLDPLLGMLKQGMEPRRLALCVAIGIVTGNIPILGVSSIVCALIALVFRLNLAAMQVVQWAMAPTQVLLIIPFVRLGEWLLRAPHQPLSIESARALLAQGVKNAVVQLWEAIIHAGFAWILVAPFVTYLLYRLLTPVFEMAAAKIGGHTGADANPGKPTAQAEGKAQAQGKAQTTTQAQAAPTQAQAVTPAAAAIAAQTVGQTPPPISTVSPR